MSDQRHQHHAHRAGEGARKYRQLPAFNLRSTRPPRAKPLSHRFPQPGDHPADDPLRHATRLSGESFRGDHSVVRRSDSHLPLVFLLALSQLAVGASVAAVFVQPALPLLLIALAAGLVALGAGSLHVGQPLKAWRSFLGCGSPGSAAR